MNVGVRLDLPFSPLILPIVEKYIREVTELEQQCLVNFPPVCRERLLALLSACATFSLFVRREQDSSDTKGGQRDLAATAIGEGASVVVVPQLGLCRGCRKIFLNVSTFCSGKRERLGT